MHYKNLEPREITRDRDERKRSKLVGLQEAINIEGRDIKDIEADIERTVQAIDDHKRSYWWFTATTAGKVPFYWATLIFVIGLLVLDVFGVGLPSSDNVWLAIVLPVVFVMGECFMLFFIAEAYISIVGYPADEEKENDKRLGLFSRSRFAVMNWLKFAVVLFIGIWAWGISVSAVSTEMLMVRMDAQMQAMESGLPIPDLVEPTFWEAALHSARPWLLGALILFLHFIFTKADEFVFFGTQYSKYRPRLTRLEGHLSDAASARRTSITQIGNMYLRYVSDLDEATKADPLFRQPKEIIHSIAKGYIAECLNGDPGDYSGDYSGDGTAAAEPVVDPALDPSAGVVNHH